jgi:hypothetical protein
MIDCVGRSLAARRAGVLRHLPLAEARDVDAYRPVYAAGGDAEV